MGARDFTLSDTIERNAQLHREQVAFVYGEVERVIGAHPAIAEVAVIGVPDAQWGEAIKAICVCKPGAAVTAQAVIDFVAERIARYKRPKHVVFTGPLPRTPGGAIDRAKVRDTHGHA